MTTQVSMDRKGFLKLLVDMNLLSHKQASGLSMETKGIPVNDIREIIMERDLVAEEPLYTAWAEYFELPYINLQITTFDPEAISMISSDVAREKILVPFSLYAGELSVAFDVFDIDLIDELRRQTGCDILAHIATRTNILDAITLHYGSTDVQTAIEKIDLSQYSTHIQHNSEINVGGPIVDVSTGIIVSAIEDRASDIHIEPRDTHLEIRFRVDGVMREKYKLDHAVAPPLISRYKIMSNLDIAEKRIPQDGQIRYTTENNDIDIRVSTVPCIHGEKIVLRLLDKSNVNLDLRQMMFSKRIYHRLERVATAPHGIFFVTGPTGSGKTTTLYAMINYINSIERNIVTIEDPVEYQLPLINQIQVNHDIGLDFPSALRSVLRQDPDVILVGEIRDLETAEVATASAMTGHLVLSTLHTNNAVEAILRLVEIGVEPFMVAPSIIAVLSQRLVRRICRECKVKYIASPGEMKYFGLSDTETPPELYKGGGCSVCAGTGYSGRLAIHELVIATNEIQELILQKAASHTIARAAYAAGYRSMRFDGLKKALRGFTTLDEILRVTTAQEDFLMV